MPFVGNISLVDQWQIFYIKFMLGPLNWKIVYFMQMIIGFILRNDILDLGQIFVFNWGFILTVTLFTTLLLDD